MNTALSPGDIIECTLNSLEYGGDACAKHRGALLYLPRGVPGDTVRARVRKIRKNFGSAEIIEVLSPSPARIATTCPAFAEGCGGCQWLHIDYRTQIHWKKRILDKALSKALGAEIESEPVAPMREPFAFRNKLSLQRDAQGRFGFMKENSKTLVYLKECPMELPRLQRLLSKIIGFHFPSAVSQVHARGTRESSSLVMYADRASPFFEKAAKLLTRVVPGLDSVSVRTRGGVKLLAGIPFISQAVGRLTYRLPPDVFFQINYFQALKLLETARRLLAPSAAETIVDLYSGVGFFSLDLAPHAARVIGIEGSRSATEAAALNARLNRIANAKFITTAAEAGLRQLKPGEVDALLLDPPRSGCDEAVLAEIIRLKPRRIVYFSCDPVALCRDCLKLTDGGYLLGEVVPIDMFPHTYHIEAAVKLVAR